MQRSFRSSWRAGGVALFATGVILCAVAGPASSAAARGIAAASRACGASSTQVWFGLGNGGGTAGTIYYPLEFTNVGRRTCTLSGYPGVSAYGANLRQVGPAASRLPGRHRTVTLRPGQTAHAILGIRDWGALCSRRAAARGLRVSAPGQRPSQALGFAFGACAHRSVLVVGPVRPGVGIPGYTTS